MGARRYLREFVDLVSDALTTAEYTSLRRAAVLEDSDGAVIEGGLRRFGVLPLAVRPSSGAATTYVLESIADWRDRLLFVEGLWLPPQFGSAYDMTAFDLSFGGLATRQPGRVWPGLESVSFSPAGTAGGQSGRNSEPFAAAGHTQAGASSGQSARPNAGIDLQIGEAGGGLGAELGAWLYADDLTGALCLDVAPTSEAGSDFDEVTAFSLALFVTATEQRDDFLTSSLATAIPSAPVGTISGFLLNALQDVGLLAQLNEGDADVRASSFPFGRRVLGPVPSIPLEAVVDRNNGELDAEPLYRRQRTAGGGFRTTVELAAAGTGDEVLDASRDYRDRLVRIAYVIGASTILPGLADDGDGADFFAVFATHAGLPEGDAGAKFGLAALPTTGAPHAVTIFDDPGTVDVGLVYARATDGALMLYAETPRAIRATIEASPPLGIRPSTADR
jgi:hypothetical protein